MAKPKILYSFPHRLGAQRICLTAWQQVENIAKAGAQVTAICGSVARPVNDACRVITTLSMRDIRVPTKWLGRERVLAIHDWQTARWLRRHHREIDLVHAWPGAAIRTIRVASEFGIPCLLERPNTHTEYAFQAADEEAKRCGISLPQGHDHSYDEMRLRQEMAEYAECDFLLCPSDFVERTFLERGISKSKILRHRYGYDPDRFSPGQADRGKADSPGMTAIYAGVCEPRKGLHYILEAWHASGVRDDCKLLICGEFVPGYAESLRELLDHPSIEVLGHRSDLPDQMRKADVFLLSSVEEGSALVTYEALASGCVLLVSDATGAPCADGESGLVHPMRDVACLAAHLAGIRRDRAHREILRTRGIELARDLTWEKSGDVLVDAYRSAIEQSTIGKAGENAPGSIRQRNLVTSD
jgi:glycosyltransferase involved in cell wall biosynthesis